MSDERTYKSGRYTIRVKDTAGGVRLAHERANPNNPDCSWLSSSHYTDEQIALLRDVFDAEWKRRNTKAHEATAAGE